MAEKFCYHWGPVNYLSQVTQDALQDGRLIVSNDCGTCDARVPIQRSLFNKQDIACVGPRDPRCPHPDHAKFIPTWAIQSPPET